MLKDALLSAFVQNVVPLLMTVLFAALTWMVTQLGRNAGVGAKASRLGFIGEKLFHFAQVVVADLDATLKPELLEATKDGVLTAAEIAHLRDVALSRMKTLLAEQGLKEVQKVLGLAGPQLDTYLRGLLERAVDVKNASAPMKLVAGVQTSATPSSLSEALGNLPGSDSP